MFSTIMGLAGDWVRVNWHLSVDRGESSDYILDMELGREPWRLRTAVMLIVFGLVLRLVVLLQGIFPRAMDWLLRKAALAGEYS